MWVSITLWEEAKVFCKQPPGPSPSGPLWPFWLLPLTYFIPTTLVSSLFVEQARLGLATVSGSALAASFLTFYGIYLSIILLPLTHFQKIWSIRQGFVPVLPTAASTCLEQCLAHSRCLLWVELCPSKRCAQVLTLSSCECDLVWK